MSLHLDDPGYEELLRERQRTAALNSPEAIAQRDRERRAAGMLPTAEERRRAIDEIVARLASRPRLDHRSPDEIMGYDEDGLPT